MPRFLVKLGPDQYLEWSTVVDAPVTCLMTREELLADGEIEERILRTDQNGTSAFNGIFTLDDIRNYNRAGENETQLTIEEIIKAYHPLATPPPTS